MSDLRYQLRKLLPILSDEARTLKDREAKQRLYLIKAVVASSKPVSVVCEKRGQSTQHYYSWARRLLKAKSLSALLSRSKRPKRSPGKTSERVEKKIHSLRIAEPYRGPDHISRDLANLFKIICPPSTVHAVLKRRGLISSRLSKKLTKKHMKRYRRPLPGYLQMDFKYVPYLINGEQYYQLSCVDHHSSWRLIRNYRNKDQESVVKFLKELESECPFSILQLQTDNDAAFTDKYRINTNGLPTGTHPVDKWCSQHAIEHKLIPIGQKELNGKVENTHKWDDREFFSQNNFPHFESLRRSTLGYNRRWNQLRSTRALGWKTPLQVIECAYVVVLAWAISVYERGLSHPLVKLDRNGNAHLPIPKAKAEKKTTKPMSLVDRYLLWQDWNEKQKFKTLIPLLPISLSYSK